MITLTSQAERSDEELKAALERFLMWGRKYLAPWFGWYVWTAQLQARGVLHFHILLARRIPHALFLRMRGLWAEHYQMGPGSVNIIRLRSGRAAAAYMCRYMVRESDTYPRDIGVDDQGEPITVMWPVSRRTGEIYERDQFRGNSYGISAQARLGLVPVTVVTALVGAFPGLDRHAYVAFYDGPDEALAALDALLNGPAP